MAQCWVLHRVRSAHARARVRRVAQTRQGAPALIRTMQNDKCRARAKSGPLMAIMTLLRPGGTAQGLGGRFRWGQRVPRGVLDMRNSPRPFGASCPDR